MKKTAIFLAALLTIGAAVAQESAASAKTAPVATAPKVNPFTGKPLKFEEIQRQLEESKLQTLLLEEQLKQTNISQETAVVPYRKAVELAQAKASARKEEANIAAMTETVKQVVATKKASGKKKSEDAERQMRSEIEAKVRAELAQEQAPRIVMPTLTAVLMTGGTRSAVLDFEGNTLVAQEGDATPLGPVHFKSDSSVEIGGRALSVHSSTISRFVVSDKKVETKPGASSSSKPVAVASVAPAAQGASVPPPVANFQLPPLVPPPAQK